MQHHVGWGKKETQFHGTAGKAAAHKTAPSVLGRSPLESPQHHDINITWRPDGEYFAVNFVTEDQAERRIHIYDQDGTLQNISEPIVALEAPMSWRDAPSLITSSQCRSDGHYIIFLERNGLQHGEFALRPTSFQLGRSELEPQSDARITPTSIIVKRLLWNFDGSILAIQMQEKNVTRALHQQDGWQCLQLWTSNNYHYYLKQQINLHPYERIIDFSWKTEDPLHLNVVVHDNRTQRLQVVMHRFVWDIIASNCSRPNGSAPVLVIDGDRLKHTPFKYYNVPPPMAAYEINLPAAVTAVSFGPSNDGDDFSVLLSDGDSVLLFERSEERKSPLFEVKNKV